jgi:hydroxyacylglutathione hydrolase
MYFQRFYDTKLAQASYLIGCQATGDAIVVDANRDIAQYIRAAAEQGLSITHVTETHIHADFVSGSRALAHTSGARLLLSDEGDADWKYTFAAAANAQLLHDGDRIMVGNIALDVMHTPGHTPEHLAFVVTDTPAAAGPMGVVTGDFVFVGDVGRPDLLEKAAHVAGTMIAGAKTLFHSLQRFKQLPDHLQIWPGHGAGSACGKALGAVPASTLGYERVANWGLTITDEAHFVEMVLAGQPEPPTYFAQMKRINKEGPAILPVYQRPELLGAAQLDTVQRDGRLLVDTRPAAAFAAGHISGSLNIPLNASFNTWAGWLLPYDRDVVLLVDSGAESAIDAAVKELSMIGLDRVTGYFTGDALTAWQQAGGALATIPQIVVRQLEARMQRGEVDVIDVRGFTEWEHGHLPGVPNIPVGLLPAQAVRLSATGRPIVVQCQSGARSAIAASVLRAHGVTDVSNLLGGFAAWRAAGLPVASEAQTLAAAS